MRYSPVAIPITPTTSVLIKQALLKYQKRKKRKQEKQGSKKARKKKEEGWNGMEGEGGEGSAWYYKIKKFLQNAKRKLQTLHAPITKQVEKL